MEGRIDKVEILLLGDGYEWRTALEEYSYWCQEEADQRKITRKVFDEAKHWSPQLKLWQHYFEVWGEVSDAFLRWLPQASYQEIYRLDYRITLDGVTPSMKVVADTMIARDPNITRTTGYIQSPHRTKRGTRGAGGPTAFSGAAESDIRLSYYDRHKEGPALELQLQGDTLKNLVQTAAQSLAALEVETMYWHTCHHLGELMEKVCRQRIGCDTDHLQNGLWGEQGSFQDVQEVMQFECISAYRQLDYEHQYAVRQELDLIAHNGEAYDE